MQMWKTTLVFMFWCYIYLTFLKAIKERPKYASVKKGIYTRYQVFVKTLSVDIKRKKWSLIIRFIWIWTLIVHETPRWICCWFFHTFTESKIPKEKAKPEPSKKG